MVKTATSKWMPSTRDCASAWLDTSMATAWRAPSDFCRSRTPASTRWTSVASGVVLAPESVPITLVGRPVAPRMSPRSWVTVVLPLVPVTPIIKRSRAGNE